MPACKISFKRLVSEMLKVVSHLATCRHISAHAGMSTDTDTCPHPNKVYMIAIRGVDVNGTCQHMSAHLGTCRHISAHVGTYQHMSVCPNVLTHASIQDKFQMVDIRGAEGGFTCWHMSAHISTCRHVHRC